MLGSGLRRFWTQERHVGTPGSLLCDLTFVISKITVNPLKCFYCHNTHKSRRRFFEEMVYTVFSGGVPFSLNPEHTTEEYNQAKV